MKGCIVLQGSWCCDDGACYDIARVCFAGDVTPLDENCLGCGCCERIWNYAVTRVRLTNGGGIMLVV